MKIDELIDILERVKKVRGNIDVVAGSFCGTDSDHVLFKFKYSKKEPWEVDDKLTDNGELSLSMEVSEESKDRIQKGILEMTRLGYTYYRSQFIPIGSLPSPGLSCCPWHNLW